MAFSALSALLLFAAESFGWIHRDRTAKAPPEVSLAADPAVAQIAPFAILLLSSLLAGAAFTKPEIGYPLRAAAMAASLFIFRKAYWAEIAPVDAVPLLAGAIVAAVWLAVKAGGTPLTVTDILGPAPEGTALLWMAARVTGTVLLVPPIEEMFFRGYLLRALDFGGLAGKLAALALSSALFGVLHGNFMLATASGVLFGLLAFRRGRMIDPIAAHATANGCIATWAVWTGDWSVI